MSHKATVLCFAGATFLFAAPAFAAEGATPMGQPMPAETPAAASAAAPAAAPAGAATAAKKRYCVETTLTGTRMAKKICRTRDEWIRTEGFDPVAR